MLKVYNKTALTRQERMKNALLFGILAAAVCVGIQMLLIHVFTVYFDVIYVGFGLGIGYAIQYFGHGVQKRFSVLAVILTLIAILICDLSAYPASSLVYLLTKMGFDSLLSVIYRVAGLVLAWRYARII